MEEINNIPTISTHICKIDTYHTLFNNTIIFKKGKTYRMIYKSEFSCAFTCEENIHTNIYYVSTIYNEELDSIFYTKEEARKLKLKTIC